MFFTPAVVGQRCEWSQTKRRQTRVINPQMDADFRTLLSKTLRVEGAAEA
jgi:hypothetical protein